MSSRPDSFGGERFCETHGTLPSGELLCNADDGRAACFGLIDLGVVGPKHLRAIMVFSTREDSQRLDPRPGSFDVHSENVAITVNADLEWSA